MAGMQDLRDHALGYPEVDYRSTAVERAVYWHENMHAAQTQYVVNLRGTKIKCRPAGEPEEAVRMLVEHTLIHMRFPAK